MSALFPVVLKAVDNDGNISRDPRSGAGTLLYKLINLIGNTLFVNPESVSIRKTSKINTIRTFGGYKFVPWYNDPDLISFKGIVYGGLKAVLDFSVLANLSSASPLEKRVKLYYKWRPFMCFSNEMEFSLDADRPNVISYEMSLYCEEPFNLYTLLIGNIQPIINDITSSYHDYETLDSLVKSFGHEPGTSFIAGNMLAYGLSHSKFKDIALGGITKNVFILSKVLGLKGRHGK